MTLASTIVAASQMMVKSRLNDDCWGLLLTLGLTTWSVILENALDKIIPTDRSVMFHAILKMVQIVEEVHQLSLGINRSHLLDTNRSRERPYV